MKKETYIAVAVTFLFLGSLFAKEEEYRFGPGDVLDIKVFGEAEFSGAFKIGNEGTIEYPYIRKIKVDGKTKDELTTELTDKLKDGYLADPQVIIEVKEFKSKKVQIIGAIGKPGDYFLDQDTTILSLISKAGGIVTGGGKRILLLRNLGKNKSSDAASTETKPMIIDYYKLVHEGDTSQNVQLENGDVINVPKANEIFIVGNVARPGPVPFEDNMTILQAITLAGGPTLTASTKSTYILRQGATGEEKINIRFDKIMDNKEKNVILKPDDVIVVPESFF